MKMDQRLQDWVAARKRHHLSHAHVQMARELGMNPKRLGSLDNHREEPWKAPLPIFIERIYERRFGRPRPEIVLSIEQFAKQQAAKKAEKKAAKTARKAAKATGGEPSDVAGPLRPNAPWDADFAADGAGGVAREISFP